MALKHLILALASLMLYSITAEAQVFPIPNQPTHVIVDSCVGCGGSGGSVDQGASNVADPWYVRFAAAQHFICDGGTCGGASAFVDSDPFTAAMSTVNTIACVYNDAIAALGAGQAGAPRCTSDRRLYIRSLTFAGDKVDVSGSSGVGVTGTFWPTVAGSPSSVRLSDGASFYDARSIRALTFAGDKVDISGSSGVGVTGTFWQATQPVSGTFWQATQPVSGTFWQATQPVSAVALPLPTGASTLAEQQTESASLASIKTNTDPLVTAGAGGYVRQDSTATIAKESGGNLATVNTNTAPLVVAGGGGYVRQDSTATIAKETGGNLATLVTNTTPFVTAAAGGYLRQDSTATIAKESGGNLEAIFGRLGNRAQLTQFTNGTIDGSIRAAGSMPSYAADSAIVATLRDRVVGDQRYLNGWPVSTGRGLSDVGTQRVALALDSKIQLADGFGNAIQSATSMPTGAERGIGVRPIQSNRPGIPITLSSASGAQATAEIMLDGNQSGSFLIQAGTLAATLVVDFTQDGTTWVGTIFMDGTTKVLSQALTNPNAAHVYSFLAPGGTTKARVRVSAYTSGSAIATGFAGLTGDPFAVGALCTQLEGQAVAATSIPPCVMAGVDGGGLARIPRVFNTQPASSDYGTVTREINLPAAAALVDGRTNPTVSVIESDQMLFNGGTTWDRYRNNVNTTTGDSGAKITNFNGATQTNYNARGAIITAILGTISGTFTTFQTGIEWSPDGGTTWLGFTPLGANVTTPASGNTFAFFIYPTNWSQAAGVTPANLAPSATAPTQANFINAALPRTWRWKASIAGTAPSITVASVQVNYIN